MGKRLLCLALATLLALSPLACAESAECPGVETGIRSIAKYGNLVLDISGTGLLALGYDYGDIIAVTLGDETLTMPISADYTDVDVGAVVCRITSEADASGSRTILGMNNGNLATALGIAARADIDEAPGYRWDYAEGWSDDTPVFLELVEKGGYLDQVKLHRLDLSCVREDYPNLTDAQYANFRPVATTGMGANALFRSASPVNPKYNRNREADAALNAAGVQAVVNLTDSEAAMKAYEDYAQTYYSALDVIALNLVLDYEAGSFRKGLAEAFRFIADREGPCLIHCNLGKDRAGFACAVLECLMGASEDEVVADYMASYTNFYGLAPGSEGYEDIANLNIRKTLCKAFGLESLGAADLAECAEGYLLDIGMTAGEIEALKARLGTDIE